MVETAQSRFEIMIEFAPGFCSVGRRLRLGVKPVAFKRAMTFASNFESRPKMAYWYGEASGKVSRN